MFFRAKNVVGIWEVPILRDPQDHWFRSKTIVVKVHDPAWGYEWVVVTASDLCFHTTAQCKTRWDFVQAQPSCTVLENDMYRKLLVEAAQQGRVMCLYVPTPKINRLYAIHEALAKVTP